MARHLGTQTHGCQTSRNGSMHTHRHTEAQANKQANGQLEVHAQTNRLADADMHEIKDRHAEAQNTH